MVYPSTYTISARQPHGRRNHRRRAVAGRPHQCTLGGSDCFELHPDEISSYSSAPSMTSLNIAYAGVVKLGGNVQTPIANVSTITIQNNGLLTHWRNSTTALGEVHKLNLTLSSMTINAGGSINVSSMGYTATNGPGAEACGTTAGTYGGYGGDGANPGCDGPVYGSYSAPVNIGSGGFDASGGGAVILNVANTLTVNGSIVANGAFAAQGGSGGSIYLTANSLAGTGTIGAQGGSANYDGGGGGRIAVIGSTASFSGTLNAASNTGIAGRIGGAGTVFVKQSGAIGTLIVDNSSLVSARYAGLPAADYSSSFDAVILAHGGRLKVVDPSTFSITASSPTADGASDELWPDGLVKTPASLTVSSYTLTISSYSTMPSMTTLNLGYGGTFNLGGVTQAPVANVSTITIQNNGVLTHWPNSTTALGEQHKLNLTLSSMTISVGGTINVSSMGYSAANGPGAETCGTASGSYGGFGSDFATPGCAGSPYGSYLTPTNIGSGGFSNSGGGAVILNVTGALTVNGSIQANGAVLNQSGSGGSVYLTVGSLVGSGTISAQGGGGGGTVYDSGSGGRIAVIGSTASFVGTLSAASNSGVAGRIGAAGTVFIKTPVNTNGNLIVNNNNLGSTRSAYLSSSTTSGSYTFDNIFMLGHSSMTFVSFSTVTITGANVFFEGDFTSTAGVNGNLYGGIRYECFLLRFDRDLGLEP